MQIAEFLDAPQTRARSSSFDLVTVSGILWNQRLLVLSSSLAAGLLLFCTSFLLRNTYQATAIVMPPDKNSSSIAMLGAAGGGAGSNLSAVSALSLKSPADLYVGLMTSPGVEDVVIRRFGLQALYHRRHFSEARKKFEDNTVVKADAKSGLITITARDHDPNLAAALANGIVNAYDQMSARLAMTDAQRSRLFFEQQVDQTKDNLNRAEEALKYSSEKTGVLQPEGDARALIAYEAELRSRIAAKSVQLDSMKVYLSDENPQVQTAQRELQGLQGQAAGLSQKNSGEGDAAFSSRKVQTEASLEYLRKMRDVRYNETLYDLLLKNLELAKLDEAREGNIVQVVTWATPPDMKESPHRSFFLAGGVLLGALLSSAWSLIASRSPMPQQKHLTSEAQVAG